MKKLSLLLIIFIIGFIACGGGVQYKDADKARDHVNGDQKKSR
jgi:hypothetical protein